MRKLLWNLLGVLQTLALASVIAFVILRAVPGNPGRLIAGPLAPQANVDAINAQLGTDEPLVTQYLRYVSSFVRLDWGFSYSNGADVTDVLASRLPATLELAVVAFVLALGGAILLATAASYRDRILARVVKVGALGGLGVPPFWMALVLILVLSSTLGILPGADGRLSASLEPPPDVTGMYTVDALLAGQWVVASDAAAHLVLPALALATVPCAFLTRLLTANMLDARRAPYVVVVRAKGVSMRKAHIRHVLHSSLLPTIGVSGVVLASLITGAVLVETVFNWPGVGQVVVLGIQRQDFAVVQVAVMLSALLYVLANLLADIAMSFADPRVRARTR